MDKIKIVIIDDGVEIVEYFSLVLSKEPNFDVVGTANSGKEAVDVIQSLNPDIVLLDISMETPKAGFEVMNNILNSEALKKPKFIVLTIHKDDDTLFQAFSYGATDFLVKNSSIVDIINSINNVASQNYYLRPNVAKKIIDELETIKNTHSDLLSAVKCIMKLTNSEFEILRCLYYGDSYKDISRSRFVSEVTIRTQASNILKKFNKKSMSDVIEWLKSLKCMDNFL